MGITGGGTTLKATKNNSFLYTKILPKKSSVDNELLHAQYKFSFILMTEYKAAQDFMTLQLLPSAVHFYSGKIFLQSLLCPLLRCFQP